jgi:hypothetical protein
MKNIALMGVIVAAASLMSVGHAYAAPFNANNPNIVANYDSGPHGIPQEPEYHEGMDVVLKAGNSGNFQQWFEGTSTSEGYHGEHSVWREVGSDTSCPSGWDLYLDPHPEHGDYLTPGANYCVKTNGYLNGN